MALVNNSPRVLSLRELVHYYIEHRAEIVERRTRFDLTEAEKRAHILEGLLKAIDHIDEVIAIIRASADAESASRALIERFEFSEVQANAILAMRLRRLTGLEREELEKEYADLLKEIERLRNILSSERTIKAEVRKQILQVKRIRRCAAHGSDEVSDFGVEDLIADEPMVVTISNAGYIKRLPVSTYRKQRRGGKGITGMETKEEDFVRDLFIASTHQYMLFSSNAGRVYWRKVHELQEAGRTARGRAIVNLLNLSGEERITACLPCATSRDGKNVFMVTRNGTVKTLPKHSAARGRPASSRSISTRRQLIDVQITTGEG